MAITQELIDKTETNLNRWDDIVNEDENGTTTLDNALIVKSLAGYLAEFKSYNILGAWQTGYSYSIKDVAKESGNHYICLEAHTSGTFSTDLSSGKWGLFQVDFSNLTATGSFTGTFTGDLTGSVLQASQTNITSVGTLSSLTVSGDVTVDTSTLKVDSTNNRVGIGLSSPSHRLDVDDSSLSSANVGTVAQIKASGTSSASVIVLNVQDSFFVNGSGSLTVSGDATFDTSLLKVDATNDRVGIGLSAPSHRLDVDDSSLNSGNVGTVTRIKASGTSSAAVTVLNVQDAIYVTANGVASGDFNDTSDIKLKKNVRDFEKTGLEIVKEIKPRIFDWKQEDKGNNIFGFIAQELEEVMPTAVIQGDVKSINVTSIVSVLVQSVQELTKKVEELEK